MVSYTCHVEYRDYKVWNYSPSTEILLKHPLDYKLFHGDSFLNSNEGVITIIESSVRKNQNIPGILLLENNRTFGRTPNAKRLYYICRPDDSKLPEFLVPFDMQIGFHKNFKNKYVTFSFHNWEGKRPTGILTQNFGDVYHFPSFCEYMLYCKQLHHSLKLSILKTKQQLKLKTALQLQHEILSTPDRFGTFIKRDSDFIFSIDPNGCVDRDDALSITLLSSSPNVYKVSVYIANVWVWLDMLDLWEDLHDGRVSTVYFPETKRSMLPPALGEDLCSLNQDQLRFGFVMDFVVTENEISFHGLNQCLLKVDKNFDYEEPSLLRCAKYQMLKTATQKLQHNVKDSHEVVAFWMTQMNLHCAKEMRKQKVGIFRTVESKCDKNAVVMIPADIPPILTILEKKMSGSYTEYKHGENDNYKHEVLGFSEYIHFTSPIRRMVDLLNQLIWVAYCVQPKNIRPEVVAFCKGQLAHLDNLNDKMKKTRKLQSDCDILYKIVNCPEYIDSTVEGIIVSMNNGTKISVYIDSLHWLTQTLVPAGNAHYKFEKVTCKIFVFEKEAQMKKKVKIQLVI